MKILTMEQALRQELVKRGLPLPKRELPSQSSKPKTSMNTIGPKRAIDVGFEHFVPFEMNLGFSSVRVGDLVAAALGENQSYRGALVLLVVKETGPGYIKGRRVIEKEIVTDGPLIKLKEKQFISKLGRVGF